MTAFETENRAESVAKMKAIRREHKGVRLLECDHVKSGEFPAALNFYLGTHTRMMICNVCVRVVDSTIADWKFQNTLDRRGQRTLGRLEGIVWAAKFRLFKRRRK